MGNLIYYCGSIKYPEVVYIFNSLEQLFFNTEKDRVEGLVKVKSRPKAGWVALSFLVDNEKQIANTVINRILQ